MQGINSIQQPISDTSTVSVITIIVTVSIIELRYSIYCCIHHFRAFRNTRTLSSMVSESESRLCCYCVEA